MEEMNVNNLLHHHLPYHQRRYEFQWNPSVMFLLLLLLFHPSMLLVEAILNIIYLLLLHNIFVIHLPIIKG